jgi:ribosomal protein S1
MNGWNIVLNPPFADGLFSEQQTATWETLKKRLPLGTILTGKVYIQAQFGVFYDTGLGFPVLINVPEFGKSEGGMVFPDDYPALESTMSGYLAQFDENNRQLRTIKNWPAILSTASVA